MFELLLICTGNICRSPVAEALLRHKLADVGADVNVRSVGLLEGGRPAAEFSVDLLAARGLNASAHLSRPMTADELSRADLVVGMAREHVRAAVVEQPRTWPRTFTLKELVRRGARVGPRRADQTLEEWLAKVHEGRTTTDLLGGSPEDDVADPIGQPRAAYEAMVAELDGLTGRMVWLLWGDARLAHQEAISWRE